MDKPIANFDSNTISIKTKYPSADPTIFYEMLRFKICSDFGKDCHEDFIHLAMKIEIEADDGKLSEAYFNYSLSQRELENNKILSEIEFSVVPVENCENVDKIIADGGLRRIHVVCNNKERLPESEVLKKVKVLVEVQKADVSIKDNSGLLAVDRARMRGLLKVVEYLENHI